MRFQLSAVGLACAAFLAACGGGGGGGDGGTRQTVLFDFPGGPTVAIPPNAATTVKLKAIASSGGPVTFKSDTPEFCTVNGDTLTLVKAGECAVTATQAGHEGFAAASARQLFVIPKNPQLVSFRNPGWQPLDTQPVQLVAASLVNLPVTLASTTPAVCTVNGTTLNKVANGMCIVTASQPGDNIYAAAPTVTKNIPIGTEKSPALTFLSGYKDATNSKEEGKVDFYAGVSVAGWWCNGLCTTTVPSDGNSFKGDFTFGLSQPHDGSWMGGYHEVNVYAPKLQELSTTAHTLAGLRIDAQAAVNFSFGQNLEWFSTSNNGVKIGLVLGHLGMPKSDGKPCNVTLEAEVKPTTAATTAYSVPLKSFKVVEACGLTGLDPWNELQDFSITNVKFAASSLNVSNSSTGLAKPTYPTVITLTGPITFQ
jgi:hypothetical protein